MHTALCCWILWLENRLEFLPELTFRREIVHVTFALPTRTSRADWAFLTSVDAAKPERLCKALPVSN